MFPNHSNSRVDDRTNFWRRAAINDQKDPKPQSERNPEWLTDYQKNNLGSQQKTSNGKEKVHNTEREMVRLSVSEFWKVVETQSTSSEPAVEAEGGHGSNRDKKKSKAEQWELSLSDDSWYRAPQFHPMGTQSRRTDIEVLCEIIYGYGERYDDGTAAIGFTWLFKVNL